VGLKTIRFSGASKLKPPQETLTWKQLSAASRKNPVKVTLDGQSDPYRVVSARTDLALTGVKKPAIPFVVWLQPENNPIQGVVTQIEGTTEEQVLNRLKITA
jgi:hypothetical protein